MKDFPTDIKKIYQNERLTLVIMIANLLLALVLAILGFVKLTPNASVIKVGYGDIGGYRDGSWTDLLAFPLLAILFGILHNLIAVRIYRRRGAGMAKFFLCLTTMLIVGAFVVLIRLTQEG